MIHGIPNEEVIEKSDSQAVLRVVIPEASDYFDGHFPDFKLLPAVAQIDLVAHYAAKYFGVALSTPNIKRFKFSDKILPNSELIFKINFDAEKSLVSFKISDKAGEKSYSSGTYIAKMRQGEAERATHE